MIAHYLKTHPGPFQAVWDDEKRHEVRKNTDRTYVAGDVVALNEWEPYEGSDYTGRSILALVTFVTRGGRWGLPDDVDVLSIKVLHRSTGGPFMPEEPAK